MLGVCLGHQAIAEAFGGDVIQSGKPIHGKVSKIEHYKSILFKKIESPFNATRYHSLIVKKETLPECLEVTAMTENKIIMAIQHKKLPIFGVQFHPESIATDFGHQLLKKFSKFKKLVKIVILNLKFKFIKMKIYTQDIINDLLLKNDLSRKQSDFLVKKIFNGEINNLQTVIILTLLYQKGESFDEIYSFIKYLKSKSLKLKLKEILLIHVELAEIIKIALIFQQQLQFFSQPSI